MRSLIAALTLLVALGAGVWAFQIVDQWGLYAQPDGTTFEGHRYGDKMFVDGYVVVYGSDNWYYYAELDARGEYEASPYKVGIDDPAEIGIPRNLKRQRSAVRQAEIDAASIMLFGGQDGTLPSLMARPLWLMGTSHCQSAAIKLKSPRTAMSSPYF